MDRDSIYREYTSRLSVRDSLSSIEKEASELEENEIVKRYLRLINYLKSNEYLSGKSDDEVLDNLLDNVEQDDEEAYFLFGRDYTGHVRRTGGYYIDYNPSQFRLSAGVKLARYKSLITNKEVLITVDEIKEFENNHTVYYSHTTDPEEEFNTLRRKMFLDKIKDKDKIKKKGL